MSDESIYENAKKYEKVNMNSSPPSYQEAIKMPASQILLTAPSTNNISEFGGNNEGIRNIPQNTQLYNTQNYYPVILPNGQTDLEIQQEPPNNNIKRTLGITSFGAFCIVILVKFVLRAILRQSKDRY